MRLHRWPLLLVFLPFAAQAQRSAPEDTTRRNTFTVFAEYSNDSSHIILGDTPNRKLSGIGVQYERRLFALRYVNAAYAAEFRPFILSSDPVANDLHNQTDVINGMTFVHPPSTSTQQAFRCIPGTFGGTIVFDPTDSVTYNDVVTCSRQTTIAQGGSPIGLRLNLFPRRRLQLTFSSNGGYMYSTKPIPIPGAGSFNFTFNFGGGFEYFYQPRRSFRVEYLVQHYSNHGTAYQNPGVDSGFVRAAYAFGR